jgi:hypothetical protein
MSLLSYLSVFQIEYALLSDIQSISDGVIEFKSYADWKKLPIAPKSSVEINDKESGGTIFYELKHSFDIGNQDFPSNLKALSKLSKYPIVVKIWLNLESYFLIGDFFNPCELTWKFDTDTNRYKVKLSHNQAEPYDLMV